MCIRDRHISKTEFGNGIRSFAPPLGFIIQFDNGVTSVSYTHLLVPGKSNGRGAVAGPDIAVAINRFLTIISLT